MAKLYLEAGRVVDEVLSDSVGLKAALYRFPLESDTRMVCKLAVSALGHRRTLSAALAGAGLLPAREDGASAAGGQGASAAGKKQRRAERAPEGARRPGVALVMAYDLLLGRGIRGGGHLKRELTERKAQLQASLEAAQAEAPEEASGGGSSAMAALPRYLRVNRMRLPDAAAAKAARRLLARELQRRAVEAKADVAAARVEVDALVPDLLALDARARPWLQGIGSVEDGSFVMQDRSSCLAALGAGLEPGDLVVDACSAPGSKTAHAVELLRGRGRVVAFERDPGRAASLISRLRHITAARLVRKRRRVLANPADSGEDTGQGLEEGDPPDDRDGAVPSRPGSVVRLQAGGVRVDVRVGDFLACDPSRPPLSRARVLLVDPSCSGSGLPEHHLPGGDDGGQPSKARLRRLAAFQRRILAHALRFPGARTVVYSTCSTHREENEDVVASVLAEQPAPPFRVAEALPWWRPAPPGPAEPGAAPLEDWAQLCVRCDPEAHRCRGFFLCRLDRLPEGTAAAPAARAAAAAGPAPARRKRRRRARNGATDATAIAGAAARASVCLTPALGSRGAKRRGKGPGIRVKK